MQEDWRCLAVNYGNPLASHYLKIKDKLILSLAIKIRKMKIFFVTFEEEVRCVLLYIYFDEVDRYILYELITIIRLPRDK